MSSTGTSQSSATHVVTRTTAVTDTSKIENETRREVVASPWRQKARRGLFYVVVFFTSSVSVLVLLGVWTFFPLPVRAVLAIVLSVVVVRVKSPSPA